MSELEENQASAAASALSMDSSTTDCKLFTDAKKTLPPEVIGCARGGKAAKDHLFETGHLTANLRQRSVRGGVITLTSQVIKFVLNLIQTVALARLLMPGDFGLVAMVSPIVGFIGLFKDLGLSMATVQSTRITHEQVSSLFWINVAASVLLAILCAALSPLVGWFYQDPRATWITLVTASTFLLGGLTAQHQALLQRQMRFGALALVEILSMSTGIVAGVTTAYWGWGYWSLVAMAIVGGAVNTAGVWIASPWWPGRFTRGSGTRSMLGLGGAVTGFQLSTFINSNLDKVIIGRNLGVVELGLYSRGFSLLMLPTMQIWTPLSRVVLPMLSRLKSDPDRFRRVSLKLIHLLCVFSGLIVAVSLVCSDWIIETLLGKQWSGATEVFRWLAVVAYLIPVSSFAAGILTSLGASRALLGWGICTTVITTASLLVGLPWGITGVAISYAMGGLFIRTPILYFIVSRNSPIRFLDFWRAMWMNTLETILLVLCGLMVRYLYPELQGYLGMIVLTVFVTALHGAYMLWRKDFVLLRNLALNRTLDLGVS